MKKLTKKEIKHYKEVLVKLRERTASGVGKIEKGYLHKSAKDSSGDISAHPFHMADAASDSFDTEFNINLVSNEQDLLYEIDLALKRIEEGTFGICEECKEPISKKRLDVVPFARYCIKDQEKQEKENGR